MNEKESVLYKYRFVENTGDLSVDYTIDALKNKYFYFPKVSQVNDPFDCRFPLLSKLSDKHSMSIKTINKCREHLSNIYYIYSLCKDWNNEVMWALYAKNYEGVCLGYKVNAIQNDMYEFKGLKLKGYDEVHNIQLRQIQYDNEGKKIVRVDPKQKEEMQKNIEYSTLHKKNIWRFENEYRGSFFCKDKIKGMQECRFEYKDDVLSEVIFGNNIKEKVKKEIIGIIRENYRNFDKIRFYQINPDLDDFTLKRCSVTV